MRSSIGDFKIVQGEKEIIVIPYLEPPPPVEVANFPGEFVSLATNASRASLLGAHYVITLSILEPSPITMGSVLGRHATTLRFKAEIQADEKDSSTTPYSLF